MLGYCVANPSRLPSCPENLIGSQDTQSGTHLYREGCAHEMFPQVASVAAGESDSEQRCRSCLVLHFGVETSVLCLGCSVEHPAWRQMRLHASVCSKAVCQQPYTSSTSTVRNDREGGGTCSS